MTEVVSLLSSSPRLPTPASKDPTFQAIGIKSSSHVGNERRTEPHISSDSFDSSIFDDLQFSELEPQPLKRRRLSPEQQPRPNNSRPVLRRQQSYLLLSDNNDIDLPVTDNGSTKNTQDAITSYIWEQNLSDPIVFTSSAPEPRTSTKVREKIDSKDQENDGLLEEPLSLSQPTARGRNHLSERTANLLSNIEHLTSSQKGGMQKSAEPNYSQKQGLMSRSIHNPAAKTKMIPSISTAEDILDSSPPRPLEGSKAKRLTDAEKEEQARERAKSKAERNRQKEEEKERKKNEKDQKAREKQLAADIAEVNKSKTDKKNSTPEMIVDMAEPLKGTSVGNQITEFMKRMDVEVNFSSSFDNFVQWRRKVTSKFNEELGHWVPVPQTINKENHVLVYMPAQHFVELSTSGSVDDSDRDGSQNLSDYVVNIKQQFPRCKLIFLIEGLDAWMRKNKSTQNRAYRAAVLATDATRENAPPPSSRQLQPRRKKKDPPVYIDEDIIQDALLELQIEHSCTVQETNCATESANCIKYFTEQISTIPYRQERMVATGEAAFCMDVGQVKTGDDVKDTYVKMLQEVQRVTLAMAYGIASKYPSVGKLVDGFKRHGPDMLEDVKKSANKNGAMSESRLGSKVSRRLYKVFTGSNPLSTAGIA